MFVIRHKVSGELWNPSIRYGTCSGPKVYNERRYAKSGLSQVSGGDAYYWRYRYLTPLGERPHDNPEKLEQWNWDHLSFQYAMNDYIGDGNNWEIVEIGELNV